MQRRDLSLLVLDIIASLNFLASVSLADLHKGCFLVMKGNAEVALEILCYGWADIDNGSLPSRRWPLSLFDSKCKWIEKGVVYFEYLLCLKV